MHNPGAPSEIVLASFGELVLTGLDFIERDLYRSRPQGGWDELREYPPAVSALGVA